MGYIHLPFLIFLPALAAICLYKLNEQRDIASIIVLVGWFLAYLILCLLGEKMEDVRISLYHTFIDIPWYDMDAKLRKTFYLFLVNIQSPIKMKVKPTAEMNYFFLAQVTKTSYSYLLYLRSNK